MFRLFASLMLMPTLLTAQVVGSRWTGEPLSGAVFRPSIGVVPGDLALSAPPGEARGGEFGVGLVTGFVLEGRLRERGGSLQVAFGSPGGRPDCTVSIRILRPRGHLCPEQLSLAKRLRAARLRSRSSPIA